MSIAYLINNNKLNYRSACPQLVIIMNVYDYDFIFELIPKGRKDNLTINFWGIEIECKNKRWIVHSKHVPTGQFKFHWITSKEALIEIIERYYDEDESRKAEALKKYT